MKKSLLALAVLGAFAATGAQAQTNVTIGGIFQVNAKSYKVSDISSATPAGAARAAAASNEFRVDDDYNSRFWLTGSEDLGGGLSAIFYVENRFNTDVRQSTGNATGAGLADGDTWVGLKGNWGQVTAGKHSWMSVQGLVTEFMGANGATSSMPTGMTGTYNILNQAGIGGGYLDITRRVNSITYRSPVISGFSGTVGFSPNSGGNEGNLACTGATGVINGPYFNNPLTSTGGAAPGTAATLSSTASTTCGVLTTPGVAAGGVPVSNGSYADGREWYAQGAYANGPLWVNLAYRNYQVEGRTGADLKQWRLSGYYKIANAFKVGLQIDRNTTDAVVAGNSAASVSRTAWELPLSYTFGNNAVLFSYTKANDVSGTNNSGAKMWTLGWDYSLSKRTNVGVFYSRLSNDTFGTYQPFLAGTSFTGSALAAGESASQFAVGVKHAF